jgi:hypothetical protein
MNLLKTKSIAISIVSEKVFNEISIFTNVLKIFLLKNTEG